MSSPPPAREKRLLGTSLKMYFDLPSTLNYIDTISMLPQPSNIDLFVIPDFVSLTSSKVKLDASNSSIWLGAQDCYIQDRGAFTGEISPLTLSQAGVAIVEIGHAERRRLFGESDQDVARKAEAVVRNGMIPLICIGEKERRGLENEAVVTAVNECKPEIEAALSLVPDSAEVVLAYEPVWAIGAAKPAEAEYVVGVARGLRRLVEGRTGRTRILYGGSAGPGTWGTVKDGVDGLFLGRFAHDVENLRQVIREMKED